MTSHQKLSRSVDGVLLPGLDGSNPLGFLAAMGVLRLAQEFGDGPVSMKWTPWAGTWVPAICAGSEQALDQNALLDALCDHLANDIAAHPAQLLERLATDDGMARRQVFCDHLDHTAGNARTLADWLAAFASDLAPVDAINQLQTTRRDYYYGNLTSIIEGTDVNHLRRSLFSPWDYSDPLDNQSLHLDPSEDRRHALQWNKPAGDPDRKKAGGMLGANRLAIEAIPLFTSLPEDGTLRTVGFTGNRSSNTRWTWPLWSAKLTLPVVWSLLLSPELQDDVMKPRDVAMLRERGVVAVYRTNRILVGKTPNFTPPRRIA